MNTKHILSALFTSSALGIMFIAGCSVPMDEGDSVQAFADEETVEEASQALGPACVAKNLALEAGPIWNNSDAQTKCPNVCNPQNMNWNGQWWTTVPGAMSVCECSPRPAAVVQAGPIWSNTHAQTQCPNTCAAFSSATKWDGQWWTTVPGQMSVCECAYKAPAAVSLEAGPIWSSAEAPSKCPSACGTSRAWNGQWSTTVAGQMSVCGCACTP